MTKYIQLHDELNDHITDYQEYVTKLKHS